MIEFPKIPTRFYYYGDKEAGERLKGLGKKRYADLVTFMKPRKLKVHSNFIQMNDGSEIKTVHNYGISEVHIFVPNITVKTTGGCIPTCLCGCGITTGGVVDSPNSTYDQETETWEHDLNRIPQAYDRFKIEVCKKKADGSYEELQPLEGEMRSLDFFLHLSERVSNKYFTAAEAYIGDVPYDLSVIKSCKWEIFNLISLEYEFKREEICT